MKPEEIDRSGEVIPDRAKPDIKCAAENIDRLLTVHITRTVGQSNIPILYEAALKKFREPLTFVAAKGLADNVALGDTVIISTGWVPGSNLGVNWLPRGENDGLSGSIALAHAINYGFDGKVVFLTEEPVVPVLEAGCKACGLRTFGLEDLKRLHIGAAAGCSRVSVQSFPVDVNKAKREANSLLDELEPAAIIAVEKCGRNEKGVYHSGFGKDMSSTTAKVDYLIDEARARGIFTVGVIDTANEIGSGVIKETARKVKKYGSQCRCGCGSGIVSTVETDAVVISSVCNQGALGLAALLSGLLKKPEILLDSKSFRRTFEACINAGSLDGIRLTPTLTLGGVDIEVHVHVLELLRAIVHYEFVRYWATLDLRP